MVEIILCINFTLLVYELTNVTVAVVLLKPLSKYSRYRIAV